jgi:hypothetical protein
MSWPEKANDEGWEAWAPFNKKAMKKSSQRERENTI